MKCIQSIKQTKQVEVGTIKRVNDKEADSEVKSGYWKYIPKNEWKTATRKTKQVEVVKELSENVEGSTKNKSNKNKKSK